MEFKLISEFKSHIEVDIGSQKSFGIIFSIVFLIFGLYPLINSEAIHLWSLLVSLILLALAFLAPKTLSLPNLLWFKLGLMLGAIVAPIVMALVYITTVIPTGLFVKLIGKDLLRQKLDKNAKTYWIEREQPVGTMKDQF